MGTKGALSWGGGGIPSSSLAAVTHSLALSRGRVGWSRDGFYQAAVGLPLSPEADFLSPDMCSCEQLGLETGPPAGVTLAMPARRARSPLLERLISDQNGCGAPPNEGMGGVGPSSGGGFTASDSRAWLRSHAPSGRRGLPRARWQQDRWAEGSSAPARGEGDWG